MGKKSKTIKVNDDIIVSADIYDGSNGSQKFFVDVMDKLRGMVEFVISIKVSAAFNTYSKEHDTALSDVTFKVALQERKNDRFFINIDSNTLYSDQDFLYKVVEHLAKDVFTAIKESDNLYEDLLKLLLVIQGVLLAETVIYINDEPIPDAIVEHTAVIRNRTLN